MHGTATYDELIINNPEVSRLLTAAVINQNFRRLLLSDPGAALKTGFNSEKFALPPRIKDHILSIHARSLADFASQLLKAPKQEDNLLPTTIPTYSRMSLSAGLD